MNTTPKAADMNARRTNEPSDSRAADTGGLAVQRDPEEWMRKRFPHAWGSMSDEDAEEMIRLIEEEFEGER